MGKVVPKGPRCNKCRGKSAYSEDYDSFYCPKCRVWLERGCKSVICTYCAKRPQSPLVGASAI